MTSIFIGVFIYKTCKPQIIWNFFNIRNVLVGSMEHKANWDVWLLGRVFARNAQKAHSPMLAHLWLAVAKGAWFEHGLRLLVVQIC